MATKKTQKKQATKKAGATKGAKKAAAKKKPAKTAAAKKKATKKSAGAKSKGDEKAPAKKAKRGAAAEAEKLIEAKDGAGISAHVEQLGGDAQSTATQSARVLEEVANQKADVLSSHVAAFVKGLSSSNKRVRQASANALPQIAAVQPARVAKHLDKLKNGFADLSDVGKDGVVRTFATLCSASVAYQKRLEPVLKLALKTADGKLLVSWTETVLPALKGEPHANARAVVEARLPEIKRAAAQDIADFLGIKLRPRLR